MANYLLAYVGGGGVEGDEEARQKVMTEWMNWFGVLGEAIVDGGNPFGASKSVASGGKVGAATAGLTGYTIVKADSLDAATEMAKGCPVVTSGGSVEVYETVPVM